MELLTLLLLLPYHDGCFDLPDPVESSELILAKGGKGGGGRSGSSRSSGNGSTGPKPTGSRLSMAGKVLKREVKIRVRPGIGAGASAYERHGLLILHDKVIRYYRTVGRTLDDMSCVTGLTMLSFLTLAILLLLAEVLADSATEMGKYWLLASLLALPTVFLSTLSGSLTEWAVDAYSDVILRGGGHREAVNAFWWYSVLGMAILASLLELLTACYAYTAFKVYSRETGKGTRPALAALEAAPITILTVLATVVAATVLWA